jgi:hypothetical protein
VDHIHVLAEADGNRTRLGALAPTPVLKTGGPTRRPDASVGEDTRGSAGSPPYSRRVALFEPFFGALDRAGVRYVVVGGVAVVLHGHPRLTADLDLAVDLRPEAARRAIDALVGLGLMPSAPVDPAGFADPKTRAAWVAERGMRVFTLRDPDDPLRQVDLFADEPVPFEELWRRAKLVRVGRVDVRVASIDDLVRLKELAGRPIDRDDIEHLRRIGEVDDDIT